MRYGSEKSAEGGMSPWGDRVGGAAVGASAVVIGEKIKSNGRKANWALGIGVVLTALAAVSSSDLNSDMTTAQNLATQYQALAVSTPSAATPTSIQLEIATLRALGIQQANLSAKMAYDANLFAFNGTPVQQNSPVQNGAITSTAVAATSNNNTLIIVVLVAAAVLLAVIL